MFDVLDLQSTLLTKLTTASSLPFETAKQHLNDDIFETLRHFPSIDQSYSEVDATSNQVDTSSDEKPKDFQNRIKTIKIGILDQTFRTVLEKMLNFQKVGNEDQMQLDQQSVQNLGKPENNNIEEDHHSDTWSNIGKLLDLALYASSFSSVNASSVNEQFVDPSLPLYLLQDLFEHHTIADCEKVFWLVEERSSRISQLLPKGKLLLLRICIELLKRLSKSNNPVFCGRILMFLAATYPLSDRSGLNVKSQVNTANITRCDTQETAAISSSSSLLSLSATPLAPPSSSLSTNLVPSPTTSIGPKESSDEPSGPIDFNFYQRFWSLQKYFQYSAQQLLLTPPSTLSAPSSTSISASKENQKIVETWKQFTEALSLVLSVFESQPISQPRGSSKIEQTGDRLISLHQTKVKKEKGADDSKILDRSDPFENQTGNNEYDDSYDYFFTKYLTSSRLIRLQLKDVKFRRQILTQCLIFCRSLQFHQNFSPPPLPPPPSTTAPPAPSTPPVTPPVTPSSSSTSLSSAAAQSSSQPQVQAPSSLSTSTLALSLFPPLSTSPSPLSSLTPSSSTPSLVSNPSASPRAQSDEFNVEKQREELCKIEQRVMKQIQQLERSAPSVSPAPAPPPLPAPLSSSAPTSSSSSSLSPSSSTMVPSYSSSIVSILHRENNWLRWKLKDNCPAFERTKNPEELKRKNLPKKRPSEPIVTGLFLKHRNIDPKTQLDQQDNIPLHHGHHHHGHNDDPDDMIDDIPLPTNNSPQNKPNTSNTSTGNNNSQFEGLDCPDRKFTPELETYLQPLRTEYNLTLLSNNNSNNTNQKKKKSSSLENDKPDEQNENDDDLEKKTDKNESSSSLAETEDEKEKNDSENEPNGEYLVKNDKVYIWRMLRLVGKNHLNYFARLQFDSPETILQLLDQEKKNPSSPLSPSSPPHISSSVAPVLNASQSKISSSTESIPEIEI